MSTAILAIETSSEQASVALLIGDSENFKLITRQTEGVQNHSLNILPMVQSLFEEAGLVLSDCDAIAFGAGPGSFTGVRTACGVVQGLAFAADLPVIPIITLVALAEDERVLTGAHDVLTVLDARMGEVYWAQYCYDVADACWHIKQAPTLSSAAAVQAQVVVGLVAVGNGLAMYRDQFALPENLVGQARSAVPHATAVARLGLREFLAGQTCEPVDAQPVYLRNKVALTIAERAQ